MTRKRIEGGLPESSSVPLIGGAQPPRSRAERRATLPSARKAARDREEEAQAHRKMTSLLPLVSANGVVVAYLLAGHVGAVVITLAVSLYCLARFFQLRMDSSSTRKKPSATRHSLLR